MDHNGTGKPLTQLFPRERLGLLIEWTTCSIIDNMQALMVSGRASSIIFHCHLTFILKVSQTHADMYKLYWDGFRCPQEQVSWNYYDVMMMMTGPLMLFEVTIYMICFLNKGAHNFRCSKFQLIPNLEIFV